MGNTELPTRSRARALPARARARRGLCRSKKHRPEHMLTWQTNRSRLRAHFSSQAKMATFGLWAIQNSQRGRARARGGACHPAQKHAPETMRTWKSNRSPLRVHWSSLANTATFLLWAMQKSQRGRARARAPNARARGGVCVVQHRSIHQKLWQLGNQIGRSYGFTLVSWPTWRPFLLWAIQNSQRGRARARRVCVVQHRNRHQKLCQLGNPVGRR